MFLVLFLKVFGLGYFFVADLTAGGMLAPRFLKVRFADALGADGEPGQQLLDVLALARWTCRSRRRRKQEQFEFVSASMASVFVDRHFSLNSDYTPV